MKKVGGGGEFAVAMTERESAVSGRHQEHGAYCNMLGRVDVAGSDCPRAADRESIHAGIRDSVGFGQLGRMDHWCLG